MNNIYLFYGEDDYRLNAELGRWKTGFTEKYGEMGISVIEGESADAGELQNALESMPLLGDRKLVIIRGIPYGASVRASKRIEEVEEFLKENLGKIDAETIVVFASSNPDKRKKIFKELNKNAEVKTFSLLSGGELKTWVAEEMARRGVSASRIVSGKLAEMVGSDLWQICGEIEKLRLYADGAEVSLEDLDKLVHKNLQENVFKLTDSIGNQNKKFTLDLFEDLASGGESLQAIFYMIVRQFRIILLMKSALESGQNAELARVVGVPPFTVSKLKSQAGRFSSEELKNIYGKLLGIDIGLKTSEIAVSVDDNSALRLALEKFLIEI